MTPLNANHCVPLNPISFAQYNETSNANFLKGHETFRVQEKSELGVEPTIVLFSLTRKKITAICNYNCNATFQK